MPFVNLWKKINMVLKHFINPCINKRRWSLKTGFCHVTGDQVNFLTIYVYVMQGAQKTEANVTCIFLNRRPCIFCYIFNMLKIRNMYARTPNIKLQ